MRSTWFDKAITVTFVGIGVWSVVVGVQILGEIGRVFHG